MYSPLSPPTICFADSSSLGHGDFGKEATSAMGWIYRRDINKPLRTRNLKVPLFGGEA